MKRPLLLSLSATLVATSLLLVACTHGESDLERRTDGVVKVGAILPLTGPTAHIGQWQEEGINLALDHTREVLPDDFRLEVLFEDSKGGAKGALAAFNKLLAVDEVDAVISSLSAVSNPLVPLADQNEVPLVMIAVSYPGIAERSRWAFRNHPGSEDEARSMVQFLGTRNDLKRVAVFYINDDFGLGGAAEFAKSFAKLGREVTFSESYEKDKSDFRSEIARALATQPDGFYVIGYVDASAILIRQMREAGFSGFLACNMAMSVPKYLQAVGQGFDNSFFTVSRFDPASENPKTRQFVRAFRDRFNSVPNVFSAMAYDSIGMLTAAIQASGASRDAIRTGLSRLSGYEGAMGLLDVDEHGNVVFPLQTAAYEEGALVIVEPSAVRN